WVSDNNGSSIRKIDPTTGATTTLGTAALGFAPASVFGIGHYGSHVAFYDVNKGLVHYDPGTGSVFFTATAAQFAAAGVAAQTGCQDVACDANTCYVACIGNIVSVNMSSGAVANYAGNYSPGPNTWNY